MTYLLLTLGFVTIACLIAAVVRFAVVRGRGRGGPPVRSISWKALTAAAVALVVFTAVFDNLMIASGLFAYADEHISGIRLGLAPIEDFAYPLAAVILLPALWTLFGGDRAR